MPSKRSRCDRLCRQRCPEVCAAIGTQHGPSGFRSRPVATPPTLQSSVVRTGSTGQAR
jgi:hypothetical protein